MSERPTLCFLTGTLNALAGAERMTAVIASALAAAGYRVCVLSLWDRGSCFPLHPEIHHHALFAARPSFKAKYLSTVAGIRRFVRAHGVDTLIEVDPMLSVFTVPACMGLRLRRVAWEHCHFHQDLGRPLRRVARRLAARTGAAVVVLTERDRESWVAALRPRCPVVAIPNALPFPYPEHPASRKTRVVLAVGRLTTAKGFDVLLHAWALLADRFPDWRLRIIGDGEERANLEALRERLGLAHTVSMPGGTLDTAAEYANASVFCLSSRYEGFGLVLIEAMAYGLPVVSTRCETGPVALLREGETATLVDVDSPAALAAGVAMLLTEPDKARTYAANGRLLSRQYMTDRIAASWLSLLAEITTPPPLTPADQDH